MSKYRKDRSTDEQERKEERPLPAARKTDRVGGTPRRVPSEGDMEGRVADNDPANGPVRGEGDGGSDRGGMGQDHG